MIYFQWMLDENKRFQRGRPRDQATRRAILNAALSLAQEQGYGSVTLLDIARRAGAGRQTIYRWWPTKPHLFVELITQQVQQLARTSPSSQADLEVYLRQTFQFMRELGTITVGVLSEIQYNPELLAAYHVLVKQRRVLLSQVLEYFAQAKNTTFSVPVEDVAEIIAGALWYRTLHGHAPLDDAFAQELTDITAALLLVRPSEDG